MKNQISKIAILFMMALLITFTACNKKDSSTEPEFAAQDNSSTQSTSDDAIATSENSMNAYSSSMSRLGSGRISSTSIDSIYKATVTFTARTISDSGRIVIDFGTGVKGLDGKTRKGQILIAFTGRYRTAGTAQVVKLKDFYIDDKKIEGKKVFTHQVENSTIKTIIDITNGKVTFADGTFTTWSGHRVRIYDNNNTPYNFYDDKLTVSGANEGTSRDGKVYTAIVDPLTPLLYTFECALKQGNGFVPIKSQIKIQPSYTGALLRVIDFGTGACDKEATLTVGGKVYPFTIK